MGEQTRPLIATLPSIAEINAELDALVARARYLCALLRAAECIQGPGAYIVPAPDPGGRKRRDAPARDEYRRRIEAYLRLHGPSATTEIELALQVGRGLVTWAAKGCDSLYRDEFNRICLSPAGSEVAPTF